MSSHHDNDLTRPEQALHWAAGELMKAGVYCGHGTDNHWDEALLLLACALNTHWDDPDLPQQSLDAQALRHFRELLQQRINSRQPAAYLTRNADFAGHRFYVDDRCLVPRSPIAELIQQEFRPWLQRTPQRILDLCCGGGCIGIAAALAFPKSRADLLDISDGALEVAAINIAQHRLSHRVSAIKSDLWQAASGSYDLIVCNPPYVDAQDMAALPAEYLAEPQMALAAGSDGLDLLRPILAGAGRFLSEGGLLVVEVGNSWPAVEQAWPAVSFLWLEFEQGGHGVFAMTAEEWQQHAELFTGTE